LADIDISLGRIALEAPNIDPTRYAAMAGANGGPIVAVGTTSATFAGAHTAVIGNISDVAAPSASLRVNGVTMFTVSTTQGTGNYPTGPMFIGRRGGTIHPFTGRLFSLIARFGPNLSPAEIARTEAWVNSRTGAY
jgi:hypothetical protein